MIKIKKIKTHKNFSFLTDQYDAFFYGAALDDRTSLTKSKISARFEFSVAYLKEKYCLKLNDEEIKILNLTEYLNDLNIKKLVVDATSLDFPEILYLLNSLNGLKYVQLVEIIYIEPKEYNKVVNEEGNDEEYQLSEGRQPFSSLPIFSINTSSIGINKASLVSFLGFESSRLGQIITNDDGASYNRLLACVSVPAYMPGWENKSLLKHINHFDTIKTKLVTYPGCNPYAVYQILNQLYAENPNIVLTSLGTKPTAVGICIFLINNYHLNTPVKQLGAIYDYPIKSANRSIGIGEIYSYELLIS